VIPFALSADALHLDTPVQDDAERVYEYCQDPLFERFLTTPWPYSRVDAHYFVSTFVPDGWATGKELTWALRSAPGNPLLGVIGLRRASDSTANVGFWLGAEHRGNGYMPAALTAVVDWAFSEGTRLVAWECFLGNVASMQVARKTGFSFIGEGPGDIPSRDKQRLPSWNGVLRATDDRTVKAGWPA
jgi:RimJ/RimL family protein N-acetyltransferase